MGISKIGVVGAGTMGNGIAQTLAVAGRDVVMMDVAEEQVKRGLDTIGASLDRLIKKDKMTAAEKATAMARISTASSISALAGQPFINAYCGSKGALTTLTANLTANLVRNLWTHSVIMCGHFPEGVETFEKASIEGETRGEWYLRQMLGSANISGGRWMHFMTGNLSFQIEHHLFPDLPSNRYQEIAPQVAELFERYGLTYTSGSLPRQVASAWRKVFRLSLPNRYATMRLPRLRLRRAPAATPELAAAA